MYAATEDGGISKRFHKQNFGTLPAFDYQNKAAMHYNAQSVHAFMEGKIVDF